MHVRKLHKAEERITWNEQREKFLYLTLEIIHVQISQSDKTSLIHKEMDKSTQKIAESEKGQN